LNIHFIPTPIQSTGNSSSLALWPSGPLKLNPYGADRGV
jgi:hypothetical protein